VFEFLSRPRAFLAPVGFGVGFPFGPKLGNVASNTNTRIEVRVAEITSRAWASKSAHISCTDSFGVCALRSVSRSSPRSHMNQATRNIPNPDRLSFRYRWASCASNEVFNEGFQHPFTSMISEIGRGIRPAVTAAT
jgi:hypothetical protein